MSVDETPLSGGTPDDETPTDSEGSQLAQPEAGIFAARGAEPLDPANVPVLNVAGFLEVVTRTRKTAFLVANGNLEDELEVLIREYDDRTDAEGNPVGDADEAEPSLAEKSWHAAQVEKINAKHAEIVACTSKVVFDAMPGDEYEVLHAKHRLSNGNIPLDKLPRFANELIVQCAVEPPLTIDEVLALRKATSKGAFRALEDAAYECNNRSSNIVPK